MCYVAGFGVANCDLFFTGVPRVPREGEEMYAGGFAMRPGGGAPATMTILGRLGVRTHLETFLGDDPFSRLVEEELRRGGVEYHNLYRGTGYPTVISATMVTPKDRTFMSYRDQLTLTEAMEDGIAERFAGASIVQMQLGDLRLYEKIKRRNPRVKFVLDTGWMDDLSIETCRAHLELADYYTPNRTEALKVTGADTPEGALKVLGRYFAEPIVKLDRDGCLTMAGGAMVRVPPMANVSQVDSTGAGDAFLAGLMYGLYHGEPIAQSIVYGNVTGGACVTQLGCLTAFVDEPTLLKEAALLRPQ